MRELPKIPVPWSQRWRTIRFRMVPILVFGLAFIGTTYLWNRQLTVTQAIGEVYAQRVDLAVRVDGVLMDSPYRLWKLYDHVRQGDIVGRLDDRPTLAAIATVREELEKAKASLAASEEELRLSQADREFQHVAEARRLAVEIEQRRLAITDRQAQLAADSIDLERQQERLNVIDPLTERKYFSKVEFIDFQRLRDVAKEKVAGHRDYIAKATAELNQALARMEQLTPAEKVDAARVLAPLRTAISYQESRLRELDLQREGLEIRTPISGHIASIAAFPGQQVRAGTVLFTVAADDAEYIVSYVRPNQRVRPQVGMTVAIRARNSHEVHHAQIDRVGPQVEHVPSRQLRDQKVQEWGLPVRIPVPRELNVRPGEVVDLKFEPTTQAAPQGDDVIPARG